MGERLSSVEAKPISRKPKNKGSILAMLGLAGVLAGTAPAPAEAGQDFNLGQFVRGAADGYVDARRRQEDERRCLAQQTQSANELLTNANIDFRFDTDRANQDADRALQALSRRTDLSPADLAIERRRIETDRVRALSYAQSRLATARRTADERVNSCRPRQW